MSRDQSSTAKMAQDNNNNQQGDSKPRRQGHHKQDGNGNKFWGPANKQSKAFLKLEPAPEPTKTISVKILDGMDNEAKEKIPNYTQSGLGALLVKLMQKLMAIDKTYNLYNKDSD